MDEPSRHFSVTLPRAITDRIDRIAARKGTSRAAIVREAVLDWAARQPHELPYDPGIDADVEQG